MAFPSPLQSLGVSEQNPSWEEGMGPGSAWSKREIVRELKVIYGG